MDSDGFDHIIAPGFEFIVPTGWDQFEQRLVENHPDEESAIRSILRTLRESAQALEDLNAPPVPTLGAVLKNIPAANTLGAQR